jgi:hypothetical protein
MHGAISVNGIEFSLGFGRGLQGANDLIADAYRGDGKRFIVLAD